MKRFLRGLVLVLSVAVPFSLSAQSRDDIISGAKKEGKLTIYSVLAVPDHTQIIDAFRRKYPFIEVSLLRPGGAETIVQRVMTEAAAGRHLVDVIGADGTLMDQLIKRSLLLRYESPERESFDPAFKDKEGYWTAFYFNPKVIAYNTNAVRPEEAPKSYADLLDPKWKGKLATENTEVAWFTTLYFLWGEKKMLDYMRQFAKQDFTMRTGHTLLTQLVAAGEYPGAAVVNGPRVELTKIRGAPIDWNPPDPTVVSITTMAIAARAPHPNAAKLYVDHVLSKEIQENYLEKKFVKPSGRKGVVSAFVEKIRRAQVKMIREDMGPAEDRAKFDKLYREFVK